MYESTFRTGFFLSSVYVILEQSELYISGNKDKRLKEKIKKEQPVRNGAGAGLIAQIQHRLSGKEEERNSGTE